MPRAVDPIVARHGCEGIGTVFREIAEETPGRPRLPGVRNLIKEQPFDGARDAYELGVALAFLSL
jgi:hypothetical protein